MSTPRLYLVNASGDRVTEILAYSSVTYRQPYNDLGRWTLTLPRSVAALWHKGWGIEIQLPSGEIVSGRAVKLNVPPGQPWGMVQGYTDLYYLATRLALPEVSGNFGAQDYDVRVGALETVVKGYVADNASQAAIISERAWPFSVATDQGRGGSVTGRARFYNLLRFVQALVNAEGQNFRLSLAAGEFDLVPVQDLTGAPLFADWMQGVEFGYGWEAPSADYLYAGGQGEGMQRLIEERYIPSDLIDFGRIEDFFDYRSASDASELLQKADARLASTGSKDGYQLRVSGALWYSDKYFEGDLVTVQMNGVPFNGRVESVVLKHDQNKGWHEEVGIGVEATELLFETLRQLDLDGRIRNLEVV